MSDELHDWMARQYAFSIPAMLRAVSRTDLVKERPLLGQTVRPARGSVLASPEFAAYDPDPDYFFHWLRDSAVVMDALRVLVSEGALGPEAPGMFDDFVAFSLALCRLDGRELVRGREFRRRISPDFLAHVRSDAELEEIVGDRALGEARYNADGALDIVKWARPQNDGPALRALTLMRLSRLDVFRDRATAGAYRALIERDLDYTLAHWREPCVDLWEEVAGRHYHTRVVQYAALADGAAWMEAARDVARAKSCRAAAQALLAQLDEHFDAREGVYMSCLPGATGRPGGPAPHRLDAAVLFGVIHAARGEGPHSVLDPRALATLRRLEDLFANEYRINRRRAADCAPALGRYAGDVYFSGGAYYFSTLAAAQFYYGFAAAAGAGAAVGVSQENRTILADMLGEKAETLAAPSLEDRHRKRLFAALVERGDMFMAMVRAHTPATGELSEQFDRTSGAQTSAKNLAWSYAAFITAFASRKAARLREDA